VGDKTYYVWEKDPDYGSDHTTAVANGTSNGNVLLTGVSETLDSSVTATGTLVDDNTVFIVANYYPDNSKVANTTIYLQNTSTPYTIYKGFKSVPTISNKTQSAGAGDEAGASVYYEVLKTGGTQYVLVTGGNVQTNQAQYTVDESALFISKAETYQSYAAYTVVKNGVKTTVKVDSTLSPTMGEINAYSVLDTKGYYTKLADYTNDGATGFIKASTQTTVQAGYMAESYANGVLTVTDNTTKSYLTVANNAVVQVVNPVTEEVYTISTANIKTYSGCAMAYETDANGYISYLYVIDANTNQ
jgi:hypothetical protein